MAGYQALNMAGEQFTGLWTQRSPYRDAATGYVAKKFYQGSRFDSIWDGINREITAKLTDGRRPGSSVYNANTFPRINRYYSFKSTNYIGDEVIRVMADSALEVYDATAGQKSTIWSKSAGAGKTSFWSVGTSLYFGNGKDVKKWLFPGGWQASTAITPGTLINVGAEPGNMQMALGGLSLPIVAFSSDGTNVTLYVDPVQVPRQFPNLADAMVTFSGLAVATYLNGNTYRIVSVISTTLGIFKILTTQAVAPVTADTGTATTGTGITGPTLPAFSTTQFGITADGGQQWKCYGTAVENWGLATPLAAPKLTPVNGTRFWQPATALTLYYGIMDMSGNIQVTISPGTTGLSYPQFAPFTVPAAALGWAQTTDGTVIWGNFGPPGAWIAGATYGFPIVAGQYAVILDSNSNLQVTFGSGAAGATVPVWATALNATTTDGALTWTCLGPGVKLATDTTQYAFSTHAIDGSVSTASPVAVIQGMILGAPVTSARAHYIALSVNIDTDTQIDQVWIWRTAMGQSTLILEDQTPALLLGGGLLYYELGIPDTSVNGGGALNAFIPAPVAHQNDPPPANMIAPTYHLERIWAISGGRVVRSQGPSTVTGNGNTAFAPLAYNTPPSKPVKLVAVTVQSGGLLVFTTSGIDIILGTGTSNDPFYMTSYFKKVALSGYDAMDVVGTQIYLMESNAKVSTIQIEYPFNPQAGYVEVGFPIGDQFMNVTTGGISNPLYNPASAFLSWNIASTRDTGMYVADGAIGWFRMGVVSPPESGLVWSPRAAIAGGTSAVQSVETAPGVYTLLIGPSVSGPILMRDRTATVWGDNGTLYPSWDAKGVNLLCATGQWTEVAHVSAKSAAVGARPVVSVLMGEIAPSTKRPWNVLEVTGPDPPDTPRSVSVYSDRYSLAQNGVADTGDCILTKFDYGLQAVGDELLDWGLLAATDDERKQQAENAR